MSRNSMILYFLIVFLPLFVTFMVMPWVVRRNVFFGVSVPPSSFDDPDLKALRRWYLKWGIALCVIITVIYVIMSLTMGQDALMIPLMALTFAPIIAISMLYVIAWKRAKALKTQKKWDEESTQTVVADTSFFRGKIAVSPLWLMVYPLIIGITIGIGLMLYDQVPMKVPMQFDFDGNVSRYADKSFSLMFFAPATQAFVALVMGLVYWVMRRARPELDPNQAQKSVKQNTVFRYRWSAFIVFGGMLLLLVFLVTQLTITNVIPMEVAMWVPMIAPAILVVAVIILSLTTGQSGSRVKVIVDEKGTKKTFNRNDDAYWHLGVLYVNKNDPSLFVEKRFGVGFTMNWARPMSWVIFFGIIAAIAASVFLTGKLAG